ncbi:hypothetical protein KHU50_001579 [Colletotrichum sp. SAR 10_65]|nr:hypothetical protein KHU50_001579 [Colletotrichum sp. SAR 10_65]
MATHQNTFSVISNGAPGGAPSRPPMTSKQAQKLYKQANKVPRRSKAEQRKWEKERQEEIKKELERERAAVKAKQARDRKKAKEEEARENRRRQGQPLVDCRPSQDTIARFAPSPQELSPQRPPPSTQAIIQDCFDDFFPTASQLALELEDDEPDENSQAFAQSSLKEYESPRFTSLENSLPERTQWRVPARPVISDMASHQAKKPRTEGGVESHKSSRNSRPTAKPSSARFTSVHHTPQAELPTTAKFQTPDPKQRGNQRYTEKPNRGLPGRAPFARPAPTKPTPFREYGQTTKPTRNDHLHRTPITPKPRGILQEISRNRIPQPKPPAAAKPVFDDFFPLICTQDLMMSSQEVLEIESPAKLDSEPSSGGSLGGPEYQPSPLIEMDLAAIDWDDELDDF